MLIQGAFDASHIVCDFIAREYAFSCVWGEKKEIKEVRIAHQKGVWTLGKLVDGKFTDWFSMDDADGAEAVISKNDLLRGLIEAKKKLVPKTSYPEERKRHARILADVIEVWVGTMDTILEIHCIQPGRNATVNEFNGGIELSPRPEDWKRK